MKRSFFQAAVVSILLYGCTTWTLTKRLEKKLDGNYTRLLRAILNNSWRQRPTRHQLYGHLPPITKTIQVRRTRQARDELISDVLLWSPTYGRAKAGRPARTHIQQLWEDTGYSPEDLPEAMNDREGWRDRVRDIHAGGTTWWWWWWMVFTRPLISEFSSFFTNPFVTVPSTPIITGITVTFMFHSLFCSLARSWYLSFFLISFCRNGKVNYLAGSLFCWLSLVVWPWLGDPMVSKNLREVCPSYFIIIIIITIIFARFSYQR